MSSWVDSFLATYTEPGNADAGGRRTLTGLNDELGKAIPKICERAFTWKLQHAGLRQKIEKFQVDLMFALDFAAI